MVHGDKKQGWVPCQVLQTADEPQPGTGLPGDAAFRRQLVKILKIYKSIFYIFLNLISELLLRN